ncbi:single-stranded DNA-binding protein [Paenarthrobacter sp. NPDC057981]|uniref:single-stranded DNA-binding protein n=1 Tax=Paenarthrobacter sp. NPDC057981 TaxID=3346297 RepID=UPI0036DEF0E8
MQSFRYLAGHVGCSVKKGQRVLVAGKLRLRQWEHEGRIYHVAEIDAESVGHDLMWGSANFTRMNGTSAAPLESAPVAEGSGNPPGGSDWNAGDDDQVPPEEESVPAGLEDSEGNGQLLVNTTTGELVGAGV